MRSLARRSASSSSLLTVRRAAAISSAAMRNVAALTLKPSSRSVWATSAASPLATTSSMMSLATRSTSSSASRFMARSRRNCASKPGSRALRRTAMSAALAVDLMGGSLRSLPGGTKVLELRLDTFHGEADGAAAREHQRDSAGGGLLHLEGQGQQVENGVGLGDIDVAV